MPIPSALKPRPLHRGRPQPGHVALVDLVGDLDPGFAPERLQRARQTVRAGTLAVRRGGWDPVADAADHEAYAFVIVEGAVLRRVVIGHREGAELLGAGDLIQPAVESEGDISWRAVADTTVAVVDRRVLAEAGAYPELLQGLLGAAASRTSTVSRQLVMAQWSSADDRLVATFRALAERWGVVTPDGVALPAFLTHSVLAPLVGARRPSVTTALKRLSIAGLVQRSPDGRWIVAHSAS